jgi:DNA polymerase III gamma/tau subunit
MPLHIDYRPKTLDEFVGNESLKESLETILQRSDKPHAFLFQGPSGCGKTTLARIVAKKLGCDDNDYQELNISDARGIESARQIITEMNYKPMYGPVKVYCLDECQQSTDAFQQSLLKAFEDTPEHVFFILCTTDPDKLKKTIQNRCTKFTVKKLPGPKMATLIQYVLESENVNFPTEAIDKIVELSEGSPRQALVLLDKVIDIPDDAGVLRALDEMIKEQATIPDLCKALLTKQKWPEIAKIIKSIDSNSEWEKLRRGVMAYASEVLLNSGNPMAAEILNAFSIPWYDMGREGLVLAAYKCFLQR